MLRTDQTDSEDEEPVHPKASDTAKEAQEDLLEAIPHPKINLADFLAQREQTSKSHLECKYGNSIFSLADREIWREMSKLETWAEMQLTEQVQAACKDFSRAVGRELMGSNITSAHRLFQSVPHHQGQEDSGDDQEEDERHTILYSGELEEQLAQIIEKYTLEADSDEDHISTNYNRLLSLALFECKSLVEDILNTWFVFYMRHYPNFLDMSVFDFESMVLFTQEDIRTKNPKFLQEPLELLLELKTDFVGALSHEIGLFVLYSAKVFKTKAVQHLKSLEEGLASVAAQTNFLTMFELSVLKRRLKELQDGISQAWLFNSYGKDALVQEWLKVLFERLFLEDPICFSGESKEMFDRLEANYNPRGKGIGIHQKKPSGEGLVQKTTLKNPKHKSQEKSLKDLHTEDEASQKGSSQKTKPKPGMPKEEHKTPLLLSSLLPSIPSPWMSGSSKLSQDQQGLVAFLAQHPEIELKRKEASRQAVEELMDQEVLEEMYLVGEGGRRALGVRIKGKDANSSDRIVVIEQDSEGNNTAKEAGHSEWFQVDKSYVQNSSKAIDILSSKPSALPATTGIYVSGAVMMAGSGALGSFLFKLVQGKQKTSDLSKDLAKDTGMSVALTVFVSVMPHVALAVGSVLGIKAMVDLQKNKFIRRSKKIFIITDILARTGAKTACAVGGAITGQSLIPVPFLGAFVGGVIGGFAATAVLSSYDSLVAKRVSLEQLAFYCLMELATNQGWKLDSDGNRVAARWLTHPHEYVTSQTSERLQAFLELVTPLLTREVLREKFVEDLIKKEKSIGEIIDELFASIAYQKGSNEEVDGAFQSRWKATICLGILNHYNYLFMTQLEKLKHHLPTQEPAQTHQGHNQPILPEFQSLERFLLSACHVLDDLSPTEPLADQHKTADRVVVIVNQMLSQEKLVTLFKKL